MTHTRGHDTILVTISDRQVDALLDIRRRIGARAFRVEFDYPQRARDRAPSRHHRSNLVVHAFSHDTGWTEDIRVRESGAWAFEGTDHWHEPPQEES